MNIEILRQARSMFRDYYRREPLRVGYAPGRVEVLGNHTDYNEGFVLSAAIAQGTWFLAAPAPDSECRVVAGDVREQAVFPSTGAQPDSRLPWANYIKGVWSGITARQPPAYGFMGLFLGDVPLGAGLSSSAALEMSAALALTALCNYTIAPLEMARIGQMAEHRFAGAQCGLLDQITSLFGKADCLVLSDFRKLAVETIPAGAETLFLIMNTGVKHRLVDSHYNRRREECRRALEHFRSMLPDRRIKALRDITVVDWENNRHGLDEAASRRALHVVGENERVMEGVKCLARNDFTAFGKLMFASHESSRMNFENSCEELDFVVDTARATSGALGARLSGGGFGGSAVILVAPDSAEKAARKLVSAYKARYNHACGILSVHPAAGAVLYEDDHC